MTIELHLTREELQLVHTALRNLETVLGHEEAYLLRRVQELLAKIER